MTTHTDTPEDTALLTNLDGALKIVAEVFTPEARPSPRTVERWAERGLLPSCRITNRRFYRIGELRNALIKLAGINPPAA